MRSVKTIEVLVHGFTVQRFTVQGWSFCNLPISPEIQLFLAYEP